MKVDGEVRDLARPLDAGAQVAIVTSRDPEALELIRHDTAHVLAAAILDLYPGTKISIGPPIEDGFYYDFEFPDGVTVSEHDFEAIEAKMREHVKADEVFEREDVTPGAAMERFTRENQDYKVELIEDLVKNTGVETVSLYTNGPFTDLCRGPHAPSTKRIRAFKLLSVAGAYWRGDASRQMLTRVYGTAFHSKEDLAEHLERLEQARARDHRKLGRELELFLFSELSPGSPFWQPNGMVIWNALTDLWRTENTARGYREVKTPILYDVDLFKTSGHWHVYRENMYFTDVEDRAMGLKPMNCPAHTQIYKSERRSYRDLPIRYSEAGLVHRHEPSGTLHGLLRVRHITQDDAHIFCTEEQIPEEVNRCLDFGYAIYDRFGFEPRLELSTRPEKRIGSEEMWDRAEKALEDALDPARREVRPQRGRRRVLRAEDRLPRDRLDRPPVAARHRAARLRPARALRAHLHRRRQRRPPPGDDPPRPDGLLGALHRHPDRALRGRVPALAGARAGARAAALRPPRRVRRRGRRRAGGGRGCAPRSTTARSRWAARSARRSCARSRTCSSSAIGRPSSAPWRCADTGRATWAPSRSTRRSAGWCRRRPRRRAERAPGGRG